MTKKLIFYSVLFFILCGCENDSDYGEVETAPIIAIQNLEELNVVLDGEQTTMFTDPQGKLYIESDGELKTIEEFSEDGHPGLYLSGDFEGPAVFSSQKKLKEFLDTPKKLSDLTSKMRVLNPINENQFVSKASDNLTASTLFPSFKVATAHSLGGFVFSKNLITSPISLPYANAHLRCNQYETNCMDFNDDISSLRVVDAVACFYEGSFENTGWWLYINAINTVVEVTNLQNVKLNPNCYSFCKSFNDRITSFWVDPNYTTTIDPSGYGPGYTACGHNYDDPMCP